MPLIPNHISSTVQFPQTKVNRKAGIPKIEMALNSIRSQQRSNSLFCMFTCLTKFTRAETDYVIDQRLKDPLHNSVQPKTDTKT